MNIVLLMTAVARLRCFAKLFSRHMARFAFHDFVCAIQLEFGQAVMPERLLVKRSNIRSTPLVVRVTRATCRALLFAMQPPLLLEINADVLMTVHAKFVLCCLVERDMTAFALLFHFRVPTNHLTWHKRGFKRLRASGTGSCNQRCNHEEDRPEQEELMAS